MLLELFSGRFLKMFLGPVDVLAPRKEYQLKVKEEYNKYRVRSFYIMPYIYINSWHSLECLMVVIETCTISRIVRYGDIHAVKVKCCEFGNRSSKNMSTRFGAH